MTASSRGRIDRDLLDQLRTVLTVIDVDGTILDAVGGSAAPGIRLDTSIGGSLYDLVDPADVPLMARQLGASPSGQRGHAAGVGFPLAFAVALLDTTTGVPVDVDALATGIVLADGGPAWLISFTRHADISSRLGLAAELYGRAGFARACSAAASRHTTTTPDGVRRVLHIVVRPHSADRRLVTGDPGSHLAVALGSLSSEAGARIWPPDGLGVTAGHSIAEVPAEIRAALDADGMTDCTVARIGPGAQALAWLMWAVHSPAPEVPRGLDDLARRDTVDLLTRAAQSAPTGRQHNSASMVDRLTGLLNRAGLEATSSPVQVRSASTIVASVTNLPHINARLGSEVGDRVLCVVADELRAAVRPGDYLARISGSEFAVVMPDTPESEARSVAGELLFPFGDVDSAGLAELSSLRPDVSVGVWADPSARSMAELLNGALDPIPVMLPPDAPSLRG